MKKDFENQHTRLTQEEALELFPWLKKCDFSGGSWYVMTGGYFGNHPQYERGIWNSGIFEYGTMLNCEFHSGKMLTYRSEFVEGVWHNGTFNGIRFFKSNWINGTFNGGYFVKSNFYNGNFEKGIFENSYWHDGTFGESAISKYKYNTFKGKVPRKMIVRKRKHKGLDRKDIDSNNINPYTKPKKPVKEKLEKFFH